MREQMERLIADGVFEALNRAAFAAEAPQAKRGAVQRLDTAIYQ
jgi:hypothetical protein